MNGTNHLQEWNHATGTMMHRTVNISSTELQPQKLSKNVLVQPAVATPCTSHLFGSVWYKTWWLVSWLRPFQENEELCSILLQGFLNRLGQVEVLIKEFTCVILHRDASCNVLDSRYIFHFVIAPGAYVISMIEPW